jgi:peptide/nickel transport system permease protein
MRRLARRIADLLIVWLAVSMLAFAVGSLAPGDPAEMMLQRQTGEPPSRAAVVALRTRLGLDDPLPLQYARWVGRALRGDLGVSYRSGEPVLRDLTNRLPATIELAIAAFALALIVALPLGVFSAARRGWWIDHATRAAALLGASVPSFVSGYVLILVFSVSLRALPVAGRGGVAHLILPAVTLASGVAAGLLRLTRAALLEELAQDYVRTAYAKGLRERAVLLRHALRGALVPVVTLAAVRFGHLIGGAAIVETVFAWPGVGKHVVDSIYARDYPAVQGFVLFLGTAFVGLNLLVDLSYRALDPRAAPAAARDG